MPLTMMQAGQPTVIRKIGGREDTRQFLESLGLTIGGRVTIVSEIAGNVIVNVKDTRVAISKEMASRILVA